MRKSLVIFATLLLFSACSLIDDDLSVCGVDCRIDYTMRLVADMHMAIETKLHAEEDKAMAQALEDWLMPVFTAPTNDVELCFYSDDEADEVREHATQQVTERRSSFTFYLPRENYMHLSTVNADGGSGIYTAGIDHSATMRLHDANADTLASQARAIYTARQSIILDDSENQTFEVSLYPASSAVALVLNKAAIDMPHIDVLLSGTASGMSIKDSTFHFEHSPIVRAERVTGQCFAAVALPSRDELPSSAPRRAIAEEAALWQLTVHVTQDDGTVTETILSVDTPLKAGEIEIIRCQVQDDGSLVPVENPHVGASVTLDWNDGGQHEIDI